MKSKIIKIIFLLPVSLLTTLPAFAQGAPPATPIDGGISFLLVAGGVYGIKKLMERRKKQ